MRVEEDQYISTKCFPFPFTLCGVANYCRQVYVIFHFAQPWLTNWTAVLFLTGAGIFLFATGVFEGNLMIAQIHRTLPACYLVSLVTLCIIPSWSVSTSLLLIARSSKCLKLQRSITRAGY
jgi:hypothetical protein